MAKKPKLHKSTEILNVCRKEIQVLVEAKFRLKVGDFLTDLHIIIHVAEINDENNITTPVWLLNLTSRELYIQQDAIICDKFIHDVQLSTGEVKMLLKLIRENTKNFQSKWKTFKTMLLTTRIWWLVQRENLLHYLLCEYSDAFSKDG